MHRGGDIHKRFVVVGGKGSEGTKVHWSEETHGTLQHMFEHELDRDVAEEFAQEAETGSFVVLPASGKLLFRTLSR
jgi:hypothetical protein